MRVIATARGWDGSSMREPGDVFDMPDSVKVEPDGWFKAAPKKRGAAADDAAQAADGGENGSMPSDSIA